MAIHWSTPVWMWPLLLVIAAGAVLWSVWTYGQSVPRPGAGLKRTLIALRSAALLLLVLALAGPVVSRLLTRQRPAELAVVCEDSGSLEIVDAGAGRQAPRWDRALAVAAALDSALAGQDPPVRTVVLRGNGVQPLAEFRLTDPVISRPTSHGTNLAALRRQVADRLAGRPVRATVLFSDGQETVDVAVQGARGATGTPGGGPLLVVGVGDESGPADRMVKDLRYPDTAYQGDEVVVEFAVDHRYLPGEPGAGGQIREITARLVGPSGTVAEQTVTSADQLVPFELAFRPEASGLQAYEVQVDLLANERFPANNRASLVVNVRQDRARVLVLAGSPGWDVRFLAQAAALEQRLAVAVVYPSARGLVYADSLVPWQAPADAAGWGRWDAVVLTGWTGPWANLVWGDLEVAVSQGLGLLVMAGSTAGPGGGAVAFPPPAGLADFLPVRIERWRWLPGPLFAAVPGAVGVHPLLGGVAAGEGLGAGTGAGLADLPPLSAVADVEAGAGAEVLLTAKGRAAAGSAAEHPVLAVSERGQGRVAWFGGQHLWELAFWEPARAKPSGAAAGHAGRRLARNLLVWTASGLEESGLAFVGRQSFFEAGETIRLGAQWLDMRGQPVSGRQLSLILKGGSAAGDTLAGRSPAERSFAMPMSGARPGLAEVTLPPLAPGRYTIQLVGAGEPPVLGQVENLIVSDHSLELTQVRLDRRRLTQLATQGGGSFLDADQPGAVEDLISRLQALDWQGDQLVQRRRLDLRSGWPLLVIVTLLLATEWYLRRRHGLL